MWHVGKKFPKSILKDQCISLLILSSLTWQSLAHHRIPRSRARFWFLLFFLYVMHKWPQHNYLGACEQETVPV